MGRYLRKAKAGHFCRKRMHPLDRVLVGVAKK
jgi:hypothetical protein